MSQTLPELTAEDLRGHAASEPLWMQERRLAALAAAAGLALPRSKQTPVETAPFTREALPAPTQVTLGPAPEGVRLLDLAEAARSGDPALERELGRQTSGSGNRLHLQHLATFAGGLFCHVGRNVEVKEPLRAEISLGDDALYAPHVLVVLEEGAKADLILELTGAAGSETAMLGMVEVSLADGAQLTYTELQRLPGRTQSYWPRRAEIGRDGRLHWILADIGGRLAVADTRTTLRGPGGEAQVLATFFGGRRQHFDMNHVMVHEGHHTRSDIEARGVLQGRARAVYNANSVIRKNAKGASGWQHEHTLMLSEQARADLIPELEIAEWDVSAGHAASAGPVDPLQLYYLESRGIDPVEARRLIVAGFLASLLTDIPIAEVRERIAQIFQEKVEL